MFVSTTRWSSSMALLLLMATLHTIPPPTSQSLVALDSVAFLHSLVNSNVTSRISFPSGLLGRSNSDSVWPPDALKCNATIYTGANAKVILAKCVAKIKPWIVLDKEAGATQAELDCKSLYMSAYCLNLVGCLACTSAQSASLHDTLQNLLDSQEAQVCEPWHSWYPALKCLPKRTDDVDKCTESLAKHTAAVDKCTKNAAKKLAPITDPTELMCKSLFEGERCLNKAACKHCGREAAIKWLDIYVLGFWTPKDTACTKWAAYELPMVCLEPEAEKCRNSIEAQESTYLKDAEEWLKLAKSDQERQCKSNYYMIFKFNYIACIACADAAIGPYQAYLSQTLNSYRDDCQQWKGWAPKMVCFPDMKTRAKKLADCDTIMQQNDVPQSCANKGLSKGLEFRDGNRGDMCKVIYFIQKCTYEQMLCKYCDKPVELLETAKQIWDPSQAECTEWSSEAPTWECDTFPWVIVAICVVALVAILLIVIVVVVICCNRSNGETRSSARSRGQGYGQSAGRSMQPIGTMQPVKTMQLVKTMQPTGASMQPIQV